MFIDEQTLEICREAIKQNWCAIQFVRKQTEEICLSAVKQGGHLLTCVEKQTPDKMVMLYNMFRSY